MKSFHIGWAFILTVLFSACGAHYDNEPSQRLLDQQGHFALLHPTDKQQTLVFDSVYIMSPTWWQATEWAKADGTYPWFWILLILGPIAGYAVFYFATRKQPAKPSLFLVIFLVWSVLWIGAYYPGRNKRWSSDQQVPKTTVDSVLKADGDVHLLWQNYKPI